MRGDVGAGNIGGGATQHLKMRENRIAGGGGDDAPAITAPRRTRERRADAAKRRSVAVLPSKLGTATAGDESLGVARADAVSHARGAGGELLVRPTASVERYAKQSVDLLRVVREMNVQIVSHGSIQK